MAEVWKQVSPSGLVSGEVSWLSRRDRITPLDILSKQAESTSESVSQLIQLELSYAPWLSSERCDCPLVVEWMLSPMAHELAPSPCVHSVQKGLSLRTLLLCGEGGRRAAVGIEVEVSAELLCALDELLRRCASGHELELTRWIEGRRDAGAQSCLWKTFANVLMVSDVVVRISSFFEGLENRIANAASLMELWKKP
jgi:hypothetical protein